MGAKITDTIPPAEPIPNEFKKLPEISNVHFLVHPGFIKKHRVDSKPEETDKLMGQYIEVAQALGEEELKCKD